MMTITAAELRVTLKNLPGVMSVVTNKDELLLPNNQKIFQFAVTEEINDGGEDVLVYLADFDEKSQEIKPMLASSFDQNGVFRKKLFEVFPPIYRKNKEDLILVL